MVKMKRMKRMKRTMNKEEEEEEEKMGEDDIFVLQPPHRECNDEFAHSFSLWPDR